MSVKDLLKEMEEERRRAGREKAMCRNGRKDVGV